MELFERECGVDRNRISDQVKVIFLEIEHPFSSIIFEKGSLNIPFVGNDPVEALGTRGDFQDL